MSSRTLLAAILFSNAIGAAADGQYVPARELDSNRLFEGVSPIRVRSGIAVGLGRIRAALWQTAVSWDAAGSNVLPSLFPGMQAGVAHDFQVGGDIVGETYPYPQTASTATLWRAGAPIDLNTLVTGGASMTLLVAEAIDSKGRIAGLGQQSNGSYGGFLFDGGVLTDLGTLPGGSAGPTPTAMNDHLQIVGSADSGGHSHAILWDHGTLIDLHDPTQISGDDSFALDVDRFGRAVGYAMFQVSATTQLPQAVLWDHGTVVNLGAGLSGVSYANGLNDFGEIVGTFEDPILGFRACTFASGVVTDLNTLIDPSSGLTLFAANDVDDEGRIVGAGGDQGGGHGFILEPDCKGTFTVYGAGCPGTGGVIPDLSGAGCPSPDRDFALAVAGGVPGAIGFLFVGAGSGSFAIKPGCDLQVLPLIVSPLLVALDGNGEQWFAARLPAGTPTFDLDLQEFFVDAGAAFGISATAPLALHFE